MCFNVGALRDLSSGKGKVKLNPIFSTPKAIGNHVTMLEVLLSILKEGKLKSSKQKSRVIKKINLLFTTTPSMQFTYLYAH